MGALTIREAQREKDSDAVWAILEPVIRAGETYALDHDLTREQALAYWFSDEHEVFVADDGTQIVGTYFLHPNQKGGGSHVANCGYVTAAAASGKGIARRMCSHSLECAKNRGFQAMQFNFVVKTNARAVRLWESLGFNIVGTLPEAFLHPVHGYTDAYVMYRML
ncbi:MAG: GNAT family N-acetyltransferase [Verrucomicrobia bacterium]|nr:GNAT family N-acetyltransferase [Verrucomicrobiota bacterium]